MQDLVGLHRHVVEPQTGQVHGYRRLQCKVKVPNPNESSKALCEEPGEARKEYQRTIDSAQHSTVSNVRTVGTDDVSLSDLKILSRQTTLADTISAEPHQLDPKTRSRSFPTNRIPNTCNLDCDCLCHRQNRLRSPNVINAVLGSLLTSYRISPWFSPTCDKAYCRSHTARVTYAFPHWFLRRAISVTMAYHHPLGPAFSFGMVNVRPIDAAIFYAVFKGSCGHISRLIHEGEASVRDVDPARNTPLLVRFRPVVNDYS